MQSSDLSTEVFFPILFITEIMLLIKNLMLLF